MPQMEAKSFRITRRGILAIMLMSDYHGKSLEAAVDRIAKGDVRTDRERRCMELANDAEISDPKFPEAGSEPVH